jgi:hypothetical protein
MLNEFTYTRGGTEITFEDLGVINIVSGMFVESDRPAINRAFFDASYKLGLIHLGMCGDGRDRYFELEYQRYKSKKVPVRPLHWKELEQKVEKFYEEFDGNQCFIYTQSYEVIEQFVIQNKNNLNLRYFKPEDNDVEHHYPLSLKGAFDLNMEIR